MQYEDMVTIKNLGVNNHKQKEIRVKCVVCGREKDTKEYVMKSGKGTQHSSCGRGVKTYNKKFHSHWKNMRTRTTNPKYEHASAYHGISSDYFKNFIDFYDTMYTSYKDACAIYGESNVTLDRIDNNKDYTPTNCRWVSWDLQGSNVTRSKLKKAIAPSGEISYFRSTVKFAVDKDISASTIRDYLNPNTKLTSAKGWHFEIVDCNDYRKASSVL